MEYQVKDFLNVELQDDASQNGGISFIGETVLDFVDSVGIDIEMPISEFNKILLESGIRTI